MAVMVEQRAFRPFKTCEEYLYAMKEDLAEWLNNLYEELFINVENFWDRLDTGSVLCKHANNVRGYAERYAAWRRSEGKPDSSSANNVLKYPPVKCFNSAKQGTFFARDNVSNFISWCRHALGIIDCLLFETDDLILLKNEKNVILCLLELARQGSKYGMPAPTLVLMEREIDEEIAADKKSCENGLGDSVEGETVDSDTDSDRAPPAEKATAQIVTNDLKSLDEMVAVQVKMCKCPTQFPMIRVSEGKYRIGDTKVLIFVRLLRNHVMVRVGGGWDTLAHYLDKHDPCRCKSAHKSAVGSKLTGLKLGETTLELTHAKVHYERRQEIKKDTISWGNQPYYNHIAHISPTH